MILLIDTSTPVCHLVCVKEDDMFESSWESDRSLAKGLLAYIEKQIKLHDSSWDEIQGIGVYRGPGSFTGLRIGITVMNTIADTKAVPIVGANGEDWKQNALDRLRSNENDKIVLPEYATDANITKPRK